MYISPLIPRRDIISFRREVFARTRHVYGLERYIMTHFFLHVLKLGAHSGKIYLYLLLLSAAAARFEYDVRLLAYLSIILHFPTVYW